MVITFFVDSNHAGNRADPNSHTDILLFVNKDPIRWYSKKQSTVEASTFGAKFCTMKTDVEMVEALRYKICMFGVPIDRPC